MNDIQRQFLILVTMLILSLWKITDFAIWVFQHWNNKITVIIAIILFVTTIFALKYGAYKRKGGL